MAQNFAHGNYSHTQKKARNSGGGGRTPRDRARRTLSQNLLADTHAIDLMIEAARPHGLVLEPGAGEGALTTALATMAGVEVVGYENDPLLAAKLRARTGLKIVKGDLTAATPPQEPFAVVGNTPYSITSQIVDWCLRAPAMTSATLLTQLAYAREHSGDLGLWSLVTVESWPWFHWELLGRVGRESFRPAPPADSGILRIERRPEPLIDAGGTWRELVELGFTGVGGSLSASLKTRHQGADDALARAGVERDTAVGHVHPDQWITIYREIHHDL
ncbi:ribosomal RNA small subunit methyltransferase A [Microtetraspora malaysiensis]|uniref:ribosomal RNA small subunit methyltransferase A n=1 Tax=Microtetraspora malaysiensis TaxID=161358 RepID=UPI0009FF385B|nr:rRNA adenine N(6)-methyltransferase family protein [Microtetraspora malaysiensis]